jgi:hypothetical protein
LTLDPKQIILFFDLTVDWFSAWLCGQLLYNRQLRTDRQQSPSYRPAYSRIGFDLVVIAVATAFLEVDTRPSTRFVDAQKVEKTETLASFFLQFLVNDSNSTIDPFPEMLSLAMEFQEMSPWGRGKEAETKRVKTRGDCVRCLQCSAAMC